MAGFAGRSRCQAASSRSTDLPAERGARLRDQLNLLDRDNLFVWTVSQHRRHQTTYPAALAEPAHAHLRLVRLRTPGAGRRWLEQVARGRAAGGRR
jgi:hypothetical protein